MKNIFKYLILASLGFSACTEASKEKLKAAYLPNARGEADKIILVIDSTHWVDTPLGAELKKTFLSPIKGLPRDESLFDISKVSPQKLNSVLKSARNILFVMTLDSKTPDSRVLQKYFTDQSLNQIKRDTASFMRSRRNLFARDQTALFLYASSEDLLTKKIRDHRSQIREIFEASARETLKSQLFNSRKRNLEARLKENHSLHFTIPYGWEKAREYPNFFWLRRLDTQVEQSIFVHYEPYTDTAVFNQIGTYRDKITEAYLFDGENKEVFIERQPQIPVFTERILFNGHFAVASRGLWRISDRSRGGPFISYTIVDEKAGRLYYVEGYVDAPGSPKKNLVRELETILSTFQTKSDLEDI